MIVSFTENMQWKRITFEMQMREAIYSQKRWEIEHITKKREGK
jgi:hypothetical protein